MKYTLNLLLISLLLFSCSSEPAVNSPISIAEKAYAESETPQTTNNLSAAYSEFLLTNPTSDNATEYRVKLADLQIKGNRFNAALDNLKAVLKSDFSSSYAPEAALKLADIYGTNLKNPQGQSAVQQGYIAAFPNHEKVGDITKKLGENPTDISTMLTDLGSKIYNDKTNRIDTKVANDFINIAEIHALLMPESAKSAEYLHDAGRTAGYMRSFPKAIDLYSWVVEKYPNNEQTANSTFMLGYTYDNDMKDYGEARKYYEQFLSKYPSHDLAASAKVLLDNLGVPDDEIIERLQKKQG
jgi:tetratricopeptide (TPR) repeat protein